MKSILFFAIVVMVLNSIGHIANCSAQNIELRWVVNGKEDCGGKLDELIHSNRKNKDISRSLVFLLEKTLINSINAECIYLTVFQFADENLKVFFEKKRLENNEVNIINNDYLNTLEQERIPLPIIKKISILKDKKFETYEGYKKQLEKILSENEMQKYENPIIFGTRLDPFNYSSDIYLIMMSKGKKYSNHKKFLIECLKLKHTISYDYFLEMHLNDLPIKDRLSVIDNLCKNRFSDNSIFPYYATSMLEILYKYHKKEYLDYLEQKKFDVSNEIICVVKGNCP